MLAQDAMGKIIRRLLRNLAAGQEVAGDTSTLEDRGCWIKRRSIAILDFGLIAAPKSQAVFN
jgi:acetyl-CoA synthetase